jgi:CRISPR-associated protein Csb1
MTHKQLSTLTLDDLTRAVGGSAAAFRRVVTLQPAGGPGAKVFPPTYEGGKYATEKRRINGESLDCVLLDSVQSQANRMEAALQEAIDEKRIQLPLISVDFRNTKAAWVGKISSLQAPHRIADAILRDSLSLDTGKPFRQTAIGLFLDTVSAQDATPLFRHCPTALVFGMWDSTGPRGGLGIKFARAVVSEIIGINAVPGQRTSSRIEPLQISSKVDPIYKTKDGDWTLDPNNAEQNEGKAVLFGKKGKPSEINHGNVTPSFVVQKDKKVIIRDKDNNPIPIGGFTIDRAQQTTLISLPSLRRLHFPINDSTKTNTAGRTVLTAIGLCAAALDCEKGYNLRSQCDLYADEQTIWELLGAPGTAPNQFTLSGTEAIHLLEEAVIAAKEAGLSWNTDEVLLTPRPDLVEMVIQSRNAGNADDGQEEG